MVILYLSLKEWFWVHQNLIYKV